MNTDILKKTVARLVSSPKGILAIDESLATCNARFEKLGIPTTEEKRQEYRELLITAEGVEKYISGYILFDETIRQSTKGGKSFVLVMNLKGLDVGIKVDMGLSDLPNHPGEKYTEGLEGLIERIQEYKNLGATFAKWRSTYNIGENIPSEECMKINAESFAQYAMLCQEKDIVPIVEPEILFNGNHTIKQCFDATAKNLDIVFAELKNKNVFLPGMILKTNMVLAGHDAPIQSTPTEIAQMTLECLQKHVPYDIGGIVFLSGGEKDLDATKNLNAMHKIGNLPWPLTFSYGRAIQNPELEAWAKNPSDVVGAQKLLLERAKANSLASVGQYE